MTAEAQLERLLWLIAAASVEGGAPLDELARGLDSDVDDVLDDVETLTSRAFYHPPGEGDDLQVLIEDDGRLRIWTARELRRPMRLTVREALALGLGLRLLAMRHAEPRAERLRALAGRLERELPADDVAALDALHALDAGTDPSGALATLERATRERWRVEIDYLKQGAPAPETRTVEPYALAYADGAWYCLGRCARAGAVRSFRVDRVMEARLANADGGDGGGSVPTRAPDFDVPDDFRIDDFMSGGHVYQPPEDAEETEVRVRYSPRIAAWIREHGLLDGPVAGTQDADDGGLIVRHLVVDPDWLVRRVLGYGGEAAVLEPADVRERVAAAALRIAGAIA